MSQTQLIEDAESLQELFSDEDRWMQGELTDKYQNDDLVARCFCLLGGIDKVTGWVDGTYGPGDDSYYASRNRSRALESLVHDTLHFDCGANMNEQGISSWNDVPERTVGDVQDVCAKAVERAKNVA